MYVENYIHDWVYSLIGKISVSKTDVRGSSPRGPADKKDKKFCYTNLMKKEHAMQIIWDYMHMNHALEKADLIFVLGSSDVRVAKYAATLYKQGFAPYILFSGSGSIHNHKKEREIFKGTTEADVFASLSEKEGVPKEAILIENQSQNTGENYKFSKEIIEENNLKVNKVIAVQKPYMERRTYATGKIQWPDVEFIVTSPNISLQDYSENEN